MPVIRLLCRASFFAALSAGFIFCKVCAAGWGTSGAGVLLFLADPQSAGYAGSIMAMPGSAASFLQNPGASARIYRTQVSLADSLLTEGMNYRFAALCVPTLLGSFGVSAGYLGYGSIDGKTSSGASAADPGAKDIVATFNYSRPIYRNGPTREMAGAAGVNIKIVNSTLSDYQAQAMAFDIGGFYSLPFNHRWIAGAALRNMGEKLKFINREDPLPSTFEMGVRYGDPDTDPAGVMLGFGRNLVDGRDTWTLGAGVMPVYPVMLRVGWKESADALDSGIRGGLGFEFNDIKFNYAVSGFRDFAPVHWIGVDFAWGGISDPRIAYNYYLRSNFIQARDQYLRKDYIAARQKLEEILSLYPDHGPSKEYLQKISEELDSLEQARIKNLSVYLRKAGVAMDRHDFLRAKKYYLSVQSIDPENGLAQNGLKIIDEKTGRLKNELNIRKSRSQLDRLWREAVTHFRQGELVVAREKFQDVITINPDNMEARGYIERIDTQLGKVTEMQLNEIFGRGMSYYQEGDYLTAKKYFSAVVTANPGRSDAIHYVELCGQQLKEDEDRTLSEKSVQRQSQAKDEVEALYTRGVLYFENGSLDDALKALARSRDLAIKNQMEKQAARARNTIADINSSLAEERFKEGFESFQKDHLEAAVNSYRKALEYNPDNTPAKVELDRVSEILALQYFEKGMKQYSENDPGKARISFRKALSFKSDMVEAKRALDRMAK